MKDWTKAVSGKPAPCHYGCGFMAPLTEPEQPWKAHKVCAEGTPSSGPLGNWDGIESKAVEDRPLGCGTPAPGQLSGRVCAGTGGQLSCQLCPASPTYWRHAG